MDDLDIEREAAAFKAPSLGSQVAEALRAPGWWRELERKLAEVEAASSSAADVAGKVVALETKVRRLEKDLRGLGLYTRTILQLLVDKNIVDPQAFTEKMRELDRLDGKLDGK